MNYLFRIAILLLFLPLSLYAQEETAPIELDSVEGEVRKAYELYERGRFGEAIEIYTEALDYAIRTGDRILEARCYGGLGNNYYEINKGEVSLDYIFKALKIFQEEEDIFNIILTYNDIGVSYRDFGDIEKSNKYLQIAIDISRDKGEVSDLIYPLSNVAYNQVHHNAAYEEGISNAREALRIIDENYPERDLSLRSYLYGIQAFAYYKLEDQKNYQLFKTKCIDYALEHNFMEDLVEFFQNEAQLKFESKRYKEAYTSLQKFTVYNDSLTQKKEFEKAKQIEADNFLRENEEKLLLAEKDKEYKDIIIKRSQTYNIIFAFFVVGLLCSLYYIYLKNKELATAKREAEKLSTVKSKFYSEISHELRTPLYAVIELSRLLLNENLNSTHSEYLESLNFSGNHLLSLINNVLEINKIESGELKLQILEFKLKDLINNITESLEFALRNSHNKIHLSYDKRIPKVLSGDSLKVSQVFINLISNAIKFTRNGNIYITAKLIEDHGDKVNIYFEVRDDGVGISKEKQIQIFDEFYQIDEKIKDSYKGSGLGLSIVKRLLSAMDSAIQIQSKEGEGAAFSFELSLLKINTLLSQENQEQELIGSLQDKKILIVDDNKINQLVTKKILDTHSIVSQTVDSGEKAVQHVREQYFDCILMDLHMPGMDGYEATRIIRGFNQKIAIVALTAASSEEVESKISSYDMNGYIMKPFLTGDFIGTIHKAILEKSESFT